MKTKVIYIAADGKRFDSEEQCARYEILLGHVGKAMSNLFYNKEEIHKGNAFKHNLKDIETSFKEVLDICALTIKNYSRVFLGVKNGIWQFSHALAIISDYSQDYPCLSNALYRFSCMNFTSGIEYEQPYYAKHEEDFKGRVIFNKQFKQ